MDRILLNDGTSIQNKDDLLGYLASAGIVHDGDLESVFYLLRDAIGIDEELDSALSKAEEYELIADEYKCNMDGLCDEVREIAHRLLSGKRGANYTKEYLGNALLNAIRQFEI
jgi:hypothetical protein